MSVSDDMVTGIQMPYVFRDGAVLVTLHAVLSMNDMFIVMGAQCQYNDQAVNLGFPLYYINPPRFVEGSDNVILVMQRMIADTVREFAK